jgi:hypothetical protein
MRISALLLMLAALANAQTYAYRGQPGKVLLYHAEANLLTEYANIGLAVTNANPIGDSGQTAIIFLGLGHTYTNSAPLSFSPNVSLVGAGTNKTTIWSTNGVGIGITFQPGDNSVWQDFKLVNTFTNDVTAMFGRVDGTTSCTNVFINRVWMQGDSDCIYTGQGGQDFHQRWVISNCVFTSRFDCVFFDSLSGDAAAGRYFFYQCGLEGRGRVLAPALWDGRGEVTIIRILGTNNFASFKDCSIRAQGATNLLTGAIVSQGMVAFDNTQFLLGTNGLLANPANKRFSVYLTNNASCWFYNVEGPATNTVTTSGGKFFYNESIDQNFL